MRDPTPEPILLPPSAATTKQASPLVLFAAFGTAIAVGGAFIANGRWSDDGGTRPPPAFSKDDLGMELVTRLDLGKLGALDRALAAIDLPGPERERLRTEVLDGRTQLGLIGFWDDRDVDGDTIVVTGAGVRQSVVLQKNLTFVVTPYQVGNTLLLTALHDGGGSVTVSLMTRHGPQPLRRLMVGDSIEVSAP
jgi:hypothetical protein